MAKLHHSVRVLAVAAALGVGGGLVSGGATRAAPTCSGTLPIAVHGQHIVGDYVSGIGHVALGWPPTAGVVGATTGGEGAAVPGGPGPGFHFPEGFAPGASFCLAQSQSPGFHPGGG
jgi:hypothetical protein